MMIKMSSKTRASQRDPILGEIPGIDFLRSLTATKVGNPEDIVFGKKILITGNVTKIKK